MSPFPSQVSWMGQGLPRGLMCRAAATPVEGAVLIPIDPGEPDRPLSPARRAEPLLDGFAWKRLIEALDQANAGGLESDGG